MDIKNENNNRNMVNFQD